MPTEAEAGKVLWEGGWRAHMEVEKRLEQRNHLGRKDWCRSEKAETRDCLQRGLEHSRIGTLSLLRCHISLSKLRLKKLTRSFFPPEFIHKHCGRRK